MIEKKLKEIVVAIYTIGETMKEKQELTKLLFST